MHRILYSNENKSIATVQNSMDESQKNWRTAKGTRHKCTYYESIHTEYDTSKSLFLEGNRVVTHGRCVDRMGLREAQAGGSSEILVC